MRSCCIRGSAISTSTSSASRTPPTTIAPTWRVIPNSDYAPDLAMQAIEAYDKGGFSELVLDGKHEFVERYNFGTAFLEGPQRAAISAGGRRS